MLEHEQAVDGFLHTGGPQRVAGQRLGRADVRGVVAKYRADGLQLGEVADGRGSAVRVQIINLGINGFQRHLHAALGTFAAGRDHVVAIRGSTVADDLGEDGGTTRDRVIVGLDHHHQAPQRAAQCSLRSIQGRDIAFFNPPSVAQSETVISYEAGFKAQVSKALENPEYYFLVMFGWAHRLAVLLLPILGLLFVVETVSVILQVASFRLTGKRVFRIAPLHHHFEMLGWAEIQIVVRFWIIQGLFVALGLGIFYAEWVRQ